MLLASQRCSAPCPSFPPICLQNFKLATSRTGSIPVKLPKALVLSQFKVDSLPIVVPLDVLVDGQPAGVWVCVCGWERWGCFGAEQLCEGGDWCVMRMKVRVLGWKQQRK